jgi:hypothetical protein
MDNVEKHGNREECLYCSKCASKSLYLFDLSHESMWVSGGIVPPFLSSAVNGRGWLATITAEMALVIKPCITH